MCELCEEDSNIDNISYRVDCKGCPALIKIDALNLVYLNCMYCPLLEKINAPNLKELDSDNITVSNCNILL